MPDEVVIVAIDLSKVHIYERSKEYYAILSASEKIAYIAEHIRGICEDLKVSDPRASWIICWREFGITEAASKFVSPKVKSEWIEAATELVRRYPQLTIIGGSLAVKEFQERLTRDDFLRMDAEYKKMVAEEKKDTDDISHLPAGQMYARLVSLAESSEGVNLIKNVCTVVTIRAGRVVVIERNKHYPDETETKDMDNKDTPRDIFDPGSTSSSLIPLEHFATKKSYLIGIDLCREMEFNVVQREVKEQKVSPPLVHFVLSDTVSTKLEQTAGEHICLCDSRVKPKLIQSQLPRSGSEVNLRQYNILSGKPVLSTNLKILIPFEQRIVHLLQGEIKRFPPKNPQRMALEKILRNFMGYSASIDANYIYKQLRADFLEHEAVLMATQEVKPGLFSCCRRRPKYTMPEFIQMLVRIIEAEKRVNPYLKDLVSESDSLLAETSAARAHAPKKAA